MKKQGSSSDTEPTKPSTKEHDYANPLFFPSRFVEIGKLAFSEATTEHIFNIFMNEVIDLYRAERGMLQMFDRAGEIVFEAMHNLSQADFVHPDFEDGRAMIEQAKKQRKPICWENTCEDSSSFCSICFPLGHNGDVFGIMYLDRQREFRMCNTKPCMFFMEYTDFFSMVAHQALKQQKSCPQGQKTLEEELRARHHFDFIIGRHPQIIEILQLVSRVADTDATVLIQGESGTGKELIARALHENSGRKDKPMIPVNCGALPEHLLESELFGHVRGAFTSAMQNAVGLFESADGGTIFLDEVNDMSPALQVKLLRVLQTGEYSRVGSPDIHRCDVRVIAATSQDLQKLVEEGTFREEVYYRLNIIDIWLPPLRDRKCDIPLLACHFVQVYGLKYGKPNLRLTSEAEALLMMYDFPGHVRELENTIQRAVILAEGKSITPEHFDSHISRRKSTSRVSDTPLTFKAAKQRVVEQFERDYLVDCLQAAHGNVTHAAQAADLHLTNMYAKFKKYGINPHTFKV